MNEMPRFADEVIQASRILRLTTPLGEDVLLPERAHIVEGVSQLFRIEVMVRSKQDIAPADLIGNPTPIHTDRVLRDQGFLAFHAIGMLRR
jgi:type VI secretion system secreted protein VgrG